MADEEESSTEEKSFKLLWSLDVQKTPCARASVLYGSIGSLAAGVGNFLATSRVKRSFDVAAGGFILTTLGYWLYCRYNHAKLRIQQRIVQDGMKKKLLYEGSRLDPNLSEGNKRDSDQ